MLDILEEIPVTEEIQGKETIEFTGAKAEKVSFSYGNEEILHEVSMEIPKNKIIGIQGKSGSGKSTLLKLFMRFWQAREGEIEISGLTGAKAEKVSFSYGNEEILHEVSMEIPKNKIIGIQGKSGSGKSTLLKLFMRFWQAREGEIEISGHSVNEVNTKK